MFSVSVGLCTRFPRSSSLVLPLLSGTGFSVYLLTSNSESCDEDDEEVGVGCEEELVDKPGTAYIVRYIAINSLALFGEMWFLTACPLEGIPVILAELPERKNFGSSFKKQSNSLTYTVASSLVCTSLLAVITVVGLLDVLMVSNSAELRSRLLTITRFGIHKWRERVKMHIYNNCNLCADLMFFFESISPITFFLYF